MNISTKLNEYNKQGKIFYSFEFFPPKTDFGLDNLYSRIDRMASLGPAYIDITWGAGGSTADKTFEMSKTIQKYLIPFYLHVDEKPILDSFLIACRMYGLKKGNPPSVDKWINSSGDLVIGPFKLSIIETPGHTPGGCSYLINDVIFVGDTLFKGSIGRTDLPGGDRKVLDASLIKLMKTLSPKTKVYSGHGPLTSISTEKTNNPFLIPLQNQLG